MASAPRSEANARLFVALDLPPAARSRLARWRDDALGGRDDLRLPAPGSLHLTLAFIGHRPEREIAQIEAAALDAVAGLAPALLRPLRVAAVPPRRPRLFALDLADEGGHAAAAQAAVSAALQAGGWYEPETRPFWPHVTLARVRRGGRAALPSAEPPEQAFRASEVTLYRSRLSPRGASYDPLARARLG